jgi:hypothetical protein
MNFPLDLKEQILFAYICIQIMMSLSHGHLALIPLVKSEL